MELSGDLSGELLHSSIGQLPQQMLALRDGRISSLSHVLLLVEAYCGLWENLDPGILGTAKMHDRAASCLDRHLIWKRLLRRMSLILTRFDIAFSSP